MFGINGQVMADGSFAFNGFDQGNNIPITGSGNLSNGQGIANFSFNTGNGICQSQIHFSQK